MAVTVTKIRELRPRAISAGVDGFSFVRRYRLITQDRHRETEILQWWATQPQYPQVHLTAVTVPGFSPSILDRIVPTLADGSGHCWDVSLHFEPLPQENQDEQGNPVQDPKDPDKWLPLVSESTQRVSIGLSKAYYESGYTGDTHTELAAATTAGNKSLLANSAGHPFKPPIEADATLRVYNFTFYTRTPVEVPEDIVNSAAWTFYVRGLRRTIPQYQGKIESHTIAEEIRNDIRAWRVEINVLQNPLGWRFEVLDEGMLIRADEGDPDGRGNTLSTGDFVPGQGRHRKPKDVYGEDIPGPVNLDGNGGPRGVLPPVFGSWRHYEEKDYSTIAYLKRVTDGS